MIKIQEMGRHWVGHIFGTNTGRVHLELESVCEQSEERVGKLAISDDQFGLSTYAVVISEVDEKIVINGAPIEKIEGFAQGQLIATAEFDERGNLHGGWQTTVGTSGPFELFGHTASSSSTAVLHPEQLYTSSQELGALRLHRTDVENILAAMKRKFPSSRIAVTHVDRGSDRALFDDQFIQQMDQLESLDWIKFSVQAPTGNGLNRSLTIDLGPSFNRVTAQGPDEAWVLGEVEATISSLRARQRRLPTTIGKNKLNINLVIFLGALVAMPELQIQERAWFIVGVILLLFAANRLTESLVSNFKVEFQKPRPSVFAEFWPSALTWVISATSALASAFLFEWLK